MHFKKLDLNLLAALDALFTEKNVSRAAQRLNVTQSTMSGALRPVEIQDSIPGLIVIQASDGTMRTE